MANSTHRDHAQRVIDDLNVTHYVIDALTPVDLAEDIEALSGLVLRLAAALDEREGSDTDG